MRSWQTSLPVRRAMGSDADVFGEVAQALQKARSPTDLYELWWIGCRLDENGESNSIEGRNLQPRVHAAEEWTLIRIMKDGTACVARGGETGHVPAGEWLALGPSVVLVRRRKSWVRGSYLWRQSFRVSSATAARWKIRIYLPACSRDLSEGIFEDVCEVLDDAGCWFEAKTWLGRTARRDKTVIWLSAAETPVALELLDEIIICNSDSVPPPPLTLEALGGRLGLAHDPNPSSSLGLRICGAVATTGDLVARGQTSIDGWNVACRSFDLAPAAPWRHPGPVDPFRVWQALES